MSKTKTKQGYVKRNIVEFCYSDDSKIGALRHQRDGCVVTRITRRDDVTTPNGKNLAKRAVRSENCLLWASMPCTGGSPFQNLNRHKPGGEARLAKHRSLFAKIFKSFASVARTCHAHGGRIAIEWPAGCAYWKFPQVRKLMENMA